MSGPENTLIMETTKGRVVISLRPDLAPKHLDGFMAQVGCPHGTGTGGSSHPNLPAEFNAEKHVRGTCSMARAQAPNSANSQFFICFGDTAFLDGQYTVWGQVTEGMENVDKIKRGEPVVDPDSIVSLRVAADVAGG
jgi:cyclophilin family peptidyl-prolyl cis-trans isomerase